MCSFVNLYLSLTCCGKHSPKCCMGPTCLTTNDSFDVQSNLNYFCEPSFTKFHPFNARLNGNGGI